MRIFNEARDSKIVELVSSVVGCDMVMYSNFARVFAKLLSQGSLASLTHLLASALAPYRSTQQRPLLRGSESPLAEVLDRCLCGFH